VEKGTEILVVRNLQRAREAGNIWHFDPEVNGVHKGHFGSSIKEWG
jgi:hypothetical protein